MKSVYSFEFSVGDSPTLVLVEVLSLVTDTVQQVVSSVYCVHTVLVLPLAL